MSTDLAQQSPAPPPPPLVNTAVMAASTSVLLIRLKQGGGGGGINSQKDSVRFSISGFIRDSVSPKPLSISLGPFRFFSKIRGDIHS
jgi:hypothetical protein